MLPENGNVLVCCQTKRHPPIVQAT